MITFWTPGEDGSPVQVDRHEWKERVGNMGMIPIDVGIVYRYKQGGQTLRGVPVRVITYFDGVSDGPTLGPHGLYQTLILGGPYDLVRWWHDTELEARVNHTEIMDSILTGRELPT